MVEQTDTYYAKLLTEVGENVKLFGSEQTYKTLSKQRRRRQAQSKPQEQKDVLNATLIVFNVDPKYIFEGQDKSGMRPEIMGLVTYILNHLYSHSLDDIGAFFNKNSSTLSRYKSEVENYNSNLKVDQPKITRLYETLKQLYNGKK